MACGVAWRGEIIEGRESVGERTRAQDRIAGVGMGVDREAWGGLA